MKRLVRRLAWVGVALCLVALALGVTVRLLEPPPGVTAANVRRIHEGMTLQEAEAILGRAPDKWLAIPDDLQPVEPKARLLDSASWHEEGGFVILYHDREGRVISKISGLTTESGPLDRLRSLVGW